MCGIEIRPCGAEYSLSFVQANEQFSESLTNVSQDLHYSNSKSDLAYVFTISELANRCNDVLQLKV